MPARIVQHIRHRLLTADGDKGFTLLEVIVSFVLFAIVASSATYAIVSALNASHGSQQHIDGANVAQTFIADQQQNAQSATNGSKTYTPSVKNEDFVVTRTITFFAGGTACNPGGSYRVNVTVNQKQTNKFLARSDTVITC